MLAVTVKRFYTSLDIIHHQRYLSVTLYQLDCLPHLYIGYLCNSKIRGVMTNYIQTSSSDRRPCRFCIREVGIQLGQLMYCYVKPIYVLAGTYSRTPVGKRIKELYLGLYMWASIQCNRASSLLASALMAFTLDKCPSSAAILITSIATC